MSRTVAVWYSVAERPDIRRLTCKTSKILLEPCHLDLLVRMCAENYVDLYGLEGDTWPLTFSVYGNENDDEPIIARSLYAEYRLEIWEEGEDA